VVVVIGDMILGDTLVSFITIYQILVFRLILLSPSWRKAANLCWKWPPYNERETHTHPYRLTDRYTITVVIAVTLNTFVVRHVSYYDTQMSMMGC